MAVRTRTYNDGLVSDVHLDKSASNRTPYGESWPKPSMQNTRPQTPGVRSGPRSGVFDSPSQSSPHSNPQIDTAPTNASIQPAQSSEPSSVQDTDANIHSYHVPGNDEQRHERHVAETGGSLDHVQHPEQAREVVVPSHHPCLHTEELGIPSLASGKIYRLMCRKLKRKIEDCEDDEEIVCRPPDRVLRSRERVKVLKEVLENLHEVCRSAQDEQGHEQGAVVNGEART